MQCIRKRLICFELDWGLGGGASDIFSAKVFGKVDLSVCCRTIRLLHSRFIQGSASVPAFWSAGQGIMVQ